MYQVVPNSHRWTDLSQVQMSLEHDMAYHATKHEREERIKNADHMIVDMYKPLTIEYLLIGFKNTLKDRTKLVFDGDFNKLKNNMPTVFTSVDAIIDYLKYYVNESNPRLEEWSLHRFKGFIDNTIECGFNLKRANKMEKNEVYKRVDGELDYQELRWVVRRDANGTPDESKPPAEWVSYMQHHMNEANTAIYNLNDEEALAQIRKVVALGVRALCIHGCPERVIPEELLNQD